MREHKEAVYENLRDLNLKHRAGRIPDGGYPFLKSSLQDEATTRLAEIGRLEDKPPRRRAQ